MKDVFYPKGVILDMDGLMLETERPLIPLWYKAGRLFGREIKEETVLSAIGRTGKDVRDLCMRDLGGDFPYDDFHEKLNSLVAEELGKGIDLRPGLIFFLDRLSALSIPFIVATSTGRKWATWKLERAGILDRFSLLVCGDEITRGKPAPDIFLTAAQKLNLPPAECLGFEDSPAGLMALHAAGIRSVFIKDLIQPDAEILSTVWRICRDLTEAADLLGLA